MPEESFLSEDEERLLGSFDSDFETAFEETPRESLLDEGTLPDIEDMPPLEEALLDSGSSLPSFEVEDFGESTIDIALEDIAPPREAPPIGPNDELDMSTVRGLDKEQPRSEAAPPDAMEDVSSEFLDAFSDSSSGVKEQGSESGSDDVTSQFLDFEEEAKALSTESPSPDFEPIDIDLQFDDTIPSPSSNSGPDSSGTAGFEPVTEFDDFLSPAPEGSAGAADPAGARQAEAFDDVAAVERELYGKPEPAPAGASRHAPDLSTEILLKIADELSSIRGELVSLKTQLGSLRSRGPAMAEELQTEEPPKEEAAGGFFDDEEDETIALTGDELDNILNTADFTEETAETQVPEELESSDQLEAAHAPADMSLLSEGLLPENGVYSPASEAGIEEISVSGEGLPEAQLPEEEPAEEGLSSEDFSIIADEGARPLTPAPEDTSYLEDEIGELDDIGLESAPLNEAPLVEPDLSAFEIEDEDLQTASMPEIEEELPVVEASAEDLVLEAESGLDFEEAEAIGELEPLEAIPEIDEGAFGEINLHDEGRLEADLEDISGLEELGGEDEASLLAEKIDEATVKPAEPVSMHPDEVSISLDDSYFVGGANADETGAPHESEEELVLHETADLEPESLETPAESELPGVEEQAAAMDLSAPESKLPSGEEPERLKSEIRSVLAYLDKLLDSLPEEKIEEFARSKYFDTYKRLFEELGLV